MRNNEGRIQISRRSIILGSAALSAGSIVSPAHAGESLVVIVNPANQESPNRSDLAAMFTTRKQSWGGGRRVVPFNFPAKHDLRVAFDEAVLKMGPDDIARYWIDRRIRGGNPPPKQVPSGAMIVKLVQKLDGAVGYVPKSMVSGDVRVILEL